MTDYGGKVRSYLVSVDRELHRMLSSVVEEDLFVDALKEELTRLDEAEAERLDRAGDEIKSVVQTSRDEKMAAAKAHLQSSAIELARRWEAAEKRKQLLRAQNEAKEAQASALRRELARLRAARREGAEDFEKELDAKVAEATAGAGEEEEATRRKAAQRIAGTILAYKKSPQCQSPMRELLPIDKSVSRIYQKMSYLIQGQ